MLYERRKWSDEEDCLYTDDPRIKDLALRSANLQVVSSYYRALGAREPFAWDIVGRRVDLAHLTRQFASVHVL